MSTARDDDGSMSPYLDAVGWLFAVEPSDRALRGWRPRVWIALGNGVMPAKEMRDVLKYAPSRWGLDWLGETSPGPGGTGPQGGPR